MPARTSISPVSGPWLMPEPDTPLVLIHLRGQSATLHFLLNTKPLNEFRVKLRLYRSNGNESIIFRLVTPIKWRCTHQ